jgi:hypothetical protein
MATGSGASQRTRSYGEASDERAGLAAEQGDGRVAGGADELAQARQLGGAPHHHRAQPGSGGQHTDQATSHARRVR